jgi:hypothetical protein
VLLRPDDLAAWRGSTTDEAAAVRARLLAAGASR